MNPPPEGPRPVASSCKGTRFSRCHATTLAYAGCPMATGTSSAGPRRRTYPQETSAFCERVRWRSARRNESDSLIQALLERLRIGVRAALAGHHSCRISNHVYKRANKGAH